MGNKIPKHVAIVMDGNGRWAKARKKLRTFGHKAGVDTLREIVRCASDQGVEVLSVFAFSTENWRRPVTEVSTLIRLIISALKNEVKKLHTQQVQLRVIGDLSKFSTLIQAEIKKAESLTKDNTGMVLVVAANYGGQWDITHAARQLAADVVAGKQTLDNVDEHVFGRYMSLSDLPQPDLFIRTGGEQRISNFFLWQAAYSEFYFSEKYWPDFDPAEFLKALAVFAQRERRFGDTSERES
jgi:undecaprenyl diphosphate synthase